MSPCHWTDVRERGLMTVWSDSESERSLTSILAKFSSEHVPTPPQRESEDVQSGNSQVTWCTGCKLV